MPNKLESNTFFTGPHAANCEKAKTKLLELNPGFNVYIYWSRIQRANIRRMRDWEMGKFGSQESDSFWSKKWEYDYIVFREGIIIWDGERSDTKMCFTNDNCDVVGNEFRFQRRDRKHVDWPNWMNQLRQRLGPERQSRFYLSSLTIPSTHNSHATYENVSDIYYRVPRFADCQSIGVGVKEQLEMGVQSIDLRVGSRLRLRHGKADLNGELGAVAKVMSEFLDSHSGETIMFQAKWDWWDDTHPNSEQNGTPGKVKELVQSYPRGLVLDSQPKLSECIGKMVLFNDDGTGAWQPKLGAGNWPEGQGNDDREKLWDEVQKRLAWVPTNTNLEDGLWWGVSCCSQTLDRWGSWFKVSTGQLEVTRPLKFAEYVNPRALDWLIDNRSPGRLGRVTMDFAEAGLVHELVLRNFDFFT